MESFDVRLIDVTYDIKWGEDRNTKDNTEVVIKLFGKTRENKSITILYNKFKPYCHIYDPPAGLRKKLSEHGDILKVENISLDYKGEILPFVKVTTKAPYCVPRLREECEISKADTRFIISGISDELYGQLQNESHIKIEELEGNSYKVTADEEDRVYTMQVINKYNLGNKIDNFEAYCDKSVFFSADIIFTNRFLYDMDMDTCINVKGNLVENKTEYTTDIVLQAEEFGKCDIFVPKLKVLSFDIETSIINNNIYCLGVHLLDQATGEEKTKFFASSNGVRDMKKASEEQLIDWANEERRMIRNFIQYVREEDPDVITGYNINNFDLDRVAIRANELFYNNKYNAKDAKAKLFFEIMNLGRDSKPIDKKELQNKGLMWECNGRIVIDAWQSVKTELRPKRETLGFVSQILFNDTKDNINSSKIDMEWTNRRMEVIEYCVKDAKLASRVLLHPKINTINKIMDIAIPSKLPIKDITGGQGRLIESVLIRMADQRQIAVPTSNREGYSYKGGFVYPTKPGLWEWVIGLDFSSMYPSQIIKHNICFTTYTSNKAKAAHTSPEIGASFVSQDERRGIIPEMVAGFLDSRKAAKKAMKEAKARGDTDQAEYYNRLQQAIKIMANATYGYFGTKHCRWYYNQFIAPSITAWAREEINTVIKKLEADGNVVVAGDTDSVMFTSKTRNGKDEKETLKLCVEYGTNIQQEFSKGNMHLELEKVMRRFFASRKGGDEEVGAKKRYVGSIIYPEVDMIQRGYETRRSDTFPMLSDTLEKAFTLVLDGNPNGAIKLSKDTIQKVLDGKVKNEDLIISKTVKEFDEYKNPDSMVSVQAVEKMIAQGFDFTPNMKYAYIITDGSGKLEAEPFIEGVEFTHKPDYKWYAQRMATALSRVTDVFNCDERALIQGNKQRTLFSFGNDEEDGNLSNFM